MTSWRVVAIWVGAAIGLDLLQFALFPCRIPLLSFPAGFPLAFASAGLLLRRYLGLETMGKLLGRCFVVGLILFLTLGLLSHMCN